MSRNPYADPSPYDVEPVASRVSGLAVASLVFGILCCIPGFGLIALVLGGGAMVAISRSDGRLTGRGLATAGLVLGLLGTIFTAMVGFAVLQGQSQIRWFGSSYSHVEQQDVQGLKNILSPSAQQQLTPETVARFHSDVNAAWGKYLGATQGIGDVISSYSAVAPQFEHQPRGGGRDVFPVPMKFERGTVLAFVEFSRRHQATRGAPAIENIVILDPNNQPIYLFPPGGTGAPTPAPAPAPAAPREGEQPPEGEAPPPEGEEPPG